MLSPLLQLLLTRRSSAASPEGSNSSSAGHGGACYYFASNHSIVGSHEVQDLTDLTLALHVARLEGHSSPSKARQP